jgi:hypothetical protein
MKKHGHNRDVNLELATVISLNPLTLRLDSDNLTLDGDDLIVSQTAYTTLEVGDKAIVFATNNGQIYYVLDKAVI